MKNDFYKRLSKVTLMKIYRQYFQKSKVFLYPLLGIAKGTRYVPKETYMAWKDRFTFDDVKLFCLYDQKITKSFSAFEEKKLLNNKFFYDYQLLDADKHLYIFDYSLFKNDWNKIMRGKYSKLSVKTKKKLLTFFGDKGKIAEYVESYIHPEYYFEDAAADLNVPQDSLVKLGELCSKPDFEKELLKIKQKDIPIVKNKSISLHSNNKIKEDAKEKPRRKFC